MDQAEKQRYLQDLSERYTKNSKLEENLEGSRIKFYKKGNQYVLLGITVFVVGAVLFYGAYKGFNAGKNALEYYQDKLDKYYEDKYEKDRPIIVPQNSKKSNHK